MPPTTTIPVQSLREPFYEGSVQRLYGVQANDEWMVCETTEVGSVFDVGGFFEIPGNDISRAAFRHLLYVKLSQPETWKKVASDIRIERDLTEEVRRELLNGPLERFLSIGADTHHVGMLDAISGDLSVDGLPANPSRYNVVKRFPVIKPTPSRILGTPVFDYTLMRGASRYVIPLEYIVRFGITSGSSILKKFLALSESGKKQYLSELNLQENLKPWEVLSKPITDFTTKYEPEDRNVSKQEALLISGLTPEYFVQSAKMSILGAWVVRQMLSELGLKLWDLKWEFAWDEGDLVFVDTMDSDSFRATLFLEEEGKRFALHANKQAVRDYFRLVHQDWLKDVNEAKRQAALEGIPFTEILEQGQQLGIFKPNPSLETEFLEIQTGKISLLMEHLQSKRSADALKQDFLELGRKELLMYKNKGLLDEFAALNQL